MRKPTGKRQRPTVMHAHMLRGSDAMIHPPRAVLVGLPSACSVPSPCLLRLRFSGTNNNRCLLVHKSCILFCQYPRAVLLSKVTHGN
jgi:hypothetical protein